jgi:hypothetical protein
LYDILIGNSFELYDPPLPLPELYEDGYKLRIFLNIPSIFTFLYSAATINVPTARSLALTVVGQEPYSEQRLGT